MFQLDEMCPLPNECPCSIKFQLHYRDGLIIELKDRHHPFQYFCTYSVHLTLYKRFIARLPGAPSSGCHYESMAEYLSSSISIFNCTSLILQISPTIKYLNLSIGL